MKIRLLALTFLIVAVSSCKKETVLRNNLQGEWELREIGGGQVPGLSPYFQKGNGSIYRFSDNRYEQIESGKIVNSGTYTIINDKRKINFDDVEQKFVLEGTGWDEIYFKLNGNKLKLYFGIIAADGYEATYEKIKN